VSAICLGHFTEFSQELWLYLHQWEKGTLHENL